MRMHVIGGRDLVVGFRLAGMRGEVATPEDDVAGAVARAAADPEVGILVVSSPVAERARAAIDRIRVRTGFPIVFEVPEAGGPPRDPDALMRFVGEAVGLRL
jgi:V/A-type H+-transporting ATPase subunit F